MNLFELDDNWLDLNLGTHNIFDEISLDLLSDLETMSQAFYEPKSKNVAEPKPPP